MVVSQAEWNALVAKTNDLQLWKEKKVREDELFHKKVHESFMSLIEQVTSLSVQVQVVKKESATLAAESTAAAAAQIAAATSHMKTPAAAAVSNGKNGFSSKNIFVKITSGGSKEIHEFPTDENGNLQVESVLAVYPGKGTFTYSGDLNTDVVCCCTLNKTLYFDVYLFNKLAQTMLVFN